MPNYLPPVVFDLQPTDPLSLLHWAWRRVAPEDRLRFLCEMLTPNERLTLQFGFEETEA